MPNTSPIFVKDVQTAAVTFVNADGTALKTLVTGDATSGSRVLTVGAATTDTALNDLDLWVSIGGTDYRLGICRVPIGAGTGTVAAVSVLDPIKIPSLQPDGSLLLGPGHILKASAQAAVTAAKTLTLIAQYGNY
jgi:hypothetical protein